MTRHGPKGADAWLCLDCGRTGTIGKINAAPCVGAQPLDDAELVAVIAGKEPW